jgi:prophage antirepressor-like protein
MTTPIEHMFEGKAIRTVDQDGEVWFIAKDVATTLGYSRTADAVREHCKGVGEIRTLTAGGMQTAKIITERDVYRLVMRSKLPNAERFQDWVCEEVIPSIHKTGSYGQPALNDNLLAAMSNPAQAMQLLGASIQAHEQTQQQLKAVEGVNATLVEGIEVLEEEKAELVPKAEFADRVVESEQSLSVGDAAQVLDTGQNKLYAFLREIGWVLKHKSQNRPTQTAVNAGYVERKVSEYFNPRTSVISQTISTLIKPKGLAKLDRMMNS